MFPIELGPARVSPADRVDLLVALRGCADSRNGVSLLLPLGSEVKGGQRIIGDQIRQRRIRSPVEQPLEHLFSLSDHPVKNCSNNDFDGNNRNMKIRILLELFDGGSLVPLAY